VSVLHGVRLSLDERSARLLSPWLTSAVSYGVGIPSPEIRVRVDLAGTPPVSQVVAEEAAAWLGLTADGVILSDYSGSWFTVGGSPPVICGVLARTPESADEPPRYLLQSALLLALCAIGVYELHAAGLCTTDRALLLVGESGAGKSTTATALASAGCRYLGDDGLMIRRRADDVELFAHSPLFRLTENSLARFKALQGHASSDADGKWRFDASLAFPNRYLTYWRGPTALLFLARSSGRASVLSDLAPAEAVGLLVEQSSAFGLDAHSTPRQHLDLLAQLVARSYVARLELGSEWLDDPAGAAQRLLERTQSFSHTRVNQMIPPSAGHGSL